MVLVGFGDDWMAIWRLPAMVGVVVVVGGGRSPTAVPRITRSYFSYFPPMFLRRKVKESYVGEGKLRNPGEFRSNITPRREYPTYK